MAGHSRCAIALARAGAKPYRGTGWCHVYPFPLLWSCRPVFARRRLQLLEQELAASVLPCARFVALSNRLRYANFFSVVVKACFKLRITHCSQRKRCYLRAQQETSNERGPASAASLIRQKGLGPAFATAATFCHSESGIVIQDYECKTVVTVLAKPSRLPLQLYTAPFRGKGPLFAENMI